MFFSTPQLDNVTDRDIEILEEANNALRRLLLNIIPVRQKHGDLFNWSPNCHVFSRGFKLILPHLTLRSGRYYGHTKLDDGRRKLFHTEHSWFETPDGSILDMFPVQANSLSQILLIATRGKYASCGGNLYEHRDEDLDRFNTRPVRKAARRMYQIYMSADPDSNLA